MVNYDDLVCFLNSIDDFFIEVEGKPNKIRNFISEYNSITGAGIDMNTNGIRVLSEKVKKWGLEFRIYTNERPSPPLGNDFHINRTYRTEYKYRYSDNDMVQPLLYEGFSLGYN